jgi:hypothetical protein
MPSPALPLPLDIPSVILKALKDCPIPAQATPDHKWRYAYELIVGAAASLLSAHPHYRGTSQYHNKLLSDYDPGILHTLLREAQEKVSGTEKPLNLYHPRLEVWTAGYFFNSGIMRIACSYEYTISTAYSNPPYAFLDLEKAVQFLKQKHPPLELEKELAVIQLLKTSGGEKLDKEVNELIAGLVRDISLTDQEPMSSLYERLESKDEDFFKAALFYVWCDYNWFKHRPIGYPATDHPRKDSRVQFVLTLRAYRGLCGLYTWCYNLAPIT